jgi:hypothetical protein
LSRAFPQSIQALNPVLDKWTKKIENTLTGVESGFQGKKYSKKKGVGRGQHTYIYIPIG